MILRYFVCLALLLTEILCSEESIKGELIFEDNFERDESNPNKEELGNGWTTNSDKRAKGNKQADLLDGYLQVTTHPEADHAAVIFHDAGFKNGSVSLKFKLGNKGSLNLDFVDREDKSVWAGHIFNVNLGLSKTILRDAKNGVFNMEIYKRRKAKQATPSDQESIKNSQVVIKQKLKVNQWYNLLVTIEGDLMKVYVDQDKVGELKAPGVAHPTKRWISLTSPKVAAIDDLRIYKTE